MRSRAIPSTVSSLLCAASVMFVAAPALAQPQEKSAEVSPPRNPAKAQPVKPQVGESFQDKSLNSPLDGSTGRPAGRPLNGLPDRAQERPWISALGVKVCRNIAYVTGSTNPAQTLDLYLPRGIEGHESRPRPLIIWVHGGGWRAGSKEGGPFAVLLRAGYAVASLNYRLSQEAIFPAQIYDVKAAVRYLRANAAKYNYDANNIGAWGSSAGGHLVALLGTSRGVSDLEGKEGNEDQSSSVQAVCDFFGPTDFVTMARAKGPAQPVVNSLLGGPPAEKQDLARDASPVSFVSKDAPPFLIVHGDQDKLVPLQQSRELDELLKNSGAQSQLYVVPGGEHGLRGAGPDLYRMVVEFFNKNLSWTPPADTRSTSSYDGKRVHMSDSQTQPRLIRD